MKTRNCKDGAEMTATLMLAALLVDPSRGAILDNLTKLQADEINAMEAMDKRFAVAFLSGSPPPRQSVGRAQLEDFFSDAPIVTVMQVVSGSDMLVKVGGRTVWLSGVSTANLADDDRVSVGFRAWYCPGNKTYNTALGSTNTVMHVQTLSAGRLSDLTAGIVTDHGFRIWQDGTSQMTIAKLVKSNSREAIVEDVHGKHHRVKLEALTAKDQAWVKQQKAP